MRNGTPNLTVLARRGGGGEAEAAKLRAALLEESMRIFLQNNALVRAFCWGCWGVGVDASQNERVRVPT